MSLPKRLPIKPKERRDVARLGRRITELAELDRLLTDAEAIELLEAADQAAWLAGLSRDWTGGEA